MTTQEQPVVVVIGSGAIGQAIARRVGVAKKLLLADINEDNGRAVAKALVEVGYDAEPTFVDASDRTSVDALAQKAANLGPIAHVVHTAGLSPAQATPDAIVKVDLVGTAHVLEAFGHVVAPGGSGVVISSQAGHMLPPLPAGQNEALARTPAAELGRIDFLQPDVITNSGVAYAIAKRANTLRVQAASVDWGDRGARLNSLSPGIIMTPLAHDELNSAVGEAYQRMIMASASGRVGTPDEIGAAAAFLMGEEGSFITGADLLVDGGVIAAIAAGRYQLSLGGGRN